MMLKSINNIADLRKGMWGRPRAQAGMALHHPAHRLRRSGGRKGPQNPHLVQREGPAHFRLGRPVARERRMGPGLFRRDDRLQRSHPPHPRPHALLLHPDEYDRWLHGSFDDLIGFQERCFSDELIVMDRTNEPWAKRKEVVGSLL
jgi:hypothetical protein